MILSFMQMIHQHIMTFQIHKSMRCLVYLLFQQTRFSEVKFNFDV